MSTDKATFGRRRVLQLIGGAGLAALAGCASKNTGGTGTTATTGTAGTATTATTAVADSGTAATSATTERIPEETAGPYPGDGSNGVDVLTQDGVVRRDIRASFGSATGVADGVPTTISFTLYDTGTQAPLAGAAVYVWHCDREGRYSRYSPGATNENYLRGVQETDAAGVAEFISIYPACYAGRWPHIHFEVYPSVAAATGGGTKKATSQIALPADVSSTVYATTGYEASVRNLAQVSLATDMVFSDGAELETPVVTGSVGNGYTIALNVGV
jgi:protocatechuate 3,4-dioxygenase beta subunit